MSSICIHNSNKGIYLSGVILPKLSIVYTSLFPSLLPWQSFHGSVSTVSAFRVFMVLSPQLVLSECEFVWIALTPKGCLWAQCTSLGSDSSLLWLSWTGLKKSRRQINHVNANPLLSGWAKRKRCLAMADHRWEQPRCVHWSQRSSHGQV